MKEVSPIKYAVFNIMTGNIVIAQRPIPIVTDYAPGDNTDCISMQLQTGGEKKGNIISDVLTPLPEDHPYYDPENPGELYNTKMVVAREIKSRLNLHVWSNDTEKRDYIVQRAYKILDEALQFNYKYCVNLTTAKDCITTDEPCDALTVMNALGIQGKCPYANITDPNSQYYRNPSTYFKLAGVEIFSIELLPEVNVDSLTPLPEVYHSVIGIDFEQEIKTELPVHPAIEIESSEMDIDSPAKK